MAQSSDKNLLFAILALQLDFITREELLAGMQSWIIQKQTSIGEILLKHSALTAEQGKLLDALMEEHLKRHEHDIQMSFQKLSSVELSLATLAHIDDHELQRSLQLLKLVSQIEDPSSRRLDEYRESKTSKRYQIVSLHRRGGLGEVFVAKDIELSREVALKRIQSQHSSDFENRQRFLREAEITGRLEHPGIVPVYGLGTCDDGCPYYAMRFVRGDSLQEAIRKFHANPVTKSTASFRSGSLALQFRDLLRRFVNVCDAIDYAHSRGVLHRDLKPGNIMLGEYGETLVVDWGLAKTLGTKPNTCDPYDHSILLSTTTRDSVPTIHGSAIGTPAYMSPEQAAGDIKLLGPATDIYSLGATLYHILVGKPPFSGHSDVTALLNAVQAGQFTKPRSINPAIDQEIEVICLKAMAKDTSLRYQSARALAQGVEAYLADEKLRENLEKQASLIRKASSAIFNCGVSDYERGDFGSAMDNLISAWRLRSDDDSEKMFYWSFLTDCLVRGGSSRISISPGKPIHCFEFSHTGSGMAVASSGETAWLIDTRTGASIGKPMCHSGHINAIAFSPDGNSLATASDDCTAQLWNARTGESYGSPMRHADKVFAVMFSPSECLVATGSADNTVRLWDTRAGEPIGTPMTHESSVRSVSFQPNGEQLATVSVYKCCIWNVKTGKCITIYPFCRCLAFSPDNHRIATAQIHTPIASFWNALTGTALGETMVHPDVSSCAFNPNGYQFATQSSTALRFWNAETGAAIGAIRPANPDYNSVGWGLRNFAFSPDGNYVVTWSGRSVNLWNANTYESIGLPLLQDGNVCETTFSPDGSEIAVITLNGIRLWNFVLNDTITLDEDASVIEFSPDSKRLASQSRYTVHLWNPLSGRQVGKPIKHRIESTSIPAISALAFRSDGRQVAAAAGTSLQIWDADNGELIHQRQLENGGATTLAFSPDGKRLVAGTVFSSLYIWDLSTGTLIETKSAHESNICHVTFRADNRIFATSSYDKTARLWDGATGEPVGKPMLHKEIVNSVAFSPDGNRVVTICKDKAARFWDPLTCESIGIPLAHDHVPIFVSFSSDASQLVTGTAAGKMFIWKAVSDDFFELCEKPDEKDSEVKFVGQNFEYSPNRKCAASLAIFGNSIQIWDTISGINFVEIAISEGEAETDTAQHETIFRFDKDANRICIAFRGRIQVWETHLTDSAPKLVSKIAPDRTEFAAINSIAFSPHGGILATASDDKTIRLWESESSNPIGVPFSHENRVEHVSFSSDGKLLAAAEANNTVQIWKVLSASPHGPKLHHEDIISSICFSPDGRFLATGSADCTARIWEVHTGSQLGQMQHDSGVEIVTFSADGSQLLTVTLTSSIRFWTAPNGMPLGEPRQFEDWIDSVSFVSGQNEAIAITSSSITRIWNAQSGAPLCNPIRHTKGARAAIHWESNLVVTASGDKVRFWDARNGLPIAAPLEHGFFVNNIAISPDGVHFATLFANNRLNIREFNTKTPDVPEQLRLDTADNISDSAILCAPSFQKKLDSRLADGRRKLREREAKEAFEGKRWFAAVFHLRCLTVKDPSNREWNSMLEVASEQLTAERECSVEKLISSTLSARQKVGIEILKSGLNGFFSHVNGMFCHEENIFFRPRIANWIDFAEACLPENARIGLSCGYLSGVDSDSKLARAHAVVLKCTQNDLFGISWNVILGAILFKLLQFDEAVAVLLNALQIVSTTDERIGNDEESGYAKLVSHAILSIAYGELGNERESSLHRELYRRLSLTDVAYETFWLYHHSLMLD